MIVKELFYIKHKINIYIVLFTILMVLSVGFSVTGTSYDSYVYNFWGERISAAQAYLPVVLIDGQTLGIGPLDRPRDFAVAPDGRIYLADTGNNRLIELASDYSLNQVISSFINDGEEDTFASPAGVSVSQEGNVYIADTENERIVILDDTGKLQQIIGTPKSTVVESILDEDFVYRPRRVEVDSFGRIYVIAANVYEGIMQFDPNGSFRGFIGSPRVKPSVADIFWARIATEEQRAQISLFLPIEYANFGLSSRGLLYAVVRGSYQDMEDDMVKLLNPTGVDIMRQVSRLPIIGDIEFEGSTFTSQSSFVDICGRENDMFSILDATKGRIFTYDHNGDLLYIFGGLGDMLGRFRNPVALDNIGDVLLVLDNRGITIFEPTKYAQAIHTALELYHQGKYDQSAIVWQQVLNSNPNYELAYSAIATNHLRQQNYELALTYFNLGQHRLGYSDAFGQYRYDFINKYISLIMTGLVLLIPLIYIIAKFKPKKCLGKLFGMADNTQQLNELAAQIENGKALRWIKIEFSIRKYIDSLWYGTHIIFHPFDGFWDLKHEKRGTVAAANTLLCLTIFTYVHMRQYTAFIFNERNIATVNIIVDASSILIPFLLWVGINWAFTTLMEGKGTLKDIYTMSAYAFVPFILLNIPTTLLSHILTAPEGDIMTLIRVVSVIWSIGLLLFGTMTIHEYSGLKTMVTTLLIVCGIAAALFVGLLFTSMIDHIVRFILTIYAEINYRV